MKYGERHELEIGRVDHKGRGCGTVADRTACVPFTIPGERVAATFVGRKKGVLRLDLDAVITPSPDRTDPPCPHAGVCGGCAWQHVAYERQLALKKDLVNAALAERGVPASVDAVTPCPERFHYRNRMDFCVGPDGEVGLKRQGRWDAHVDLSTCLLLSPEGAELIEAFRGWMAANGVEPWNARRHSGYARYLVVREGKRTGHRMAMVVTAEGALPAEKDLLGRFGGLATSVLHGVNPGIADLSVPDVIAPVSGDPWIEEVVAGLRFRIPPTSFFQTNTAMAERLLEEVRGHVTAASPGVLLDLYCGVGFLGLGCASAASRVVGYELDVDAAAVAAHNAAANGMTNTEFVAGKAEALLWDRERPDMVIVDPPRGGLHPRVISTLIERRPRRIVYVSCNYRTFADDWTSFGQAYDIAALTGFDLFPHSPHVELVALLELR